MAAASVGSLGISLTAVRPRLVEKDKSQGVAGLGHRSCRPLSLIGDGRLLGLVGSPPPAQPSLAPVPTSRARPFAEFP
jgi:hypothetical protein